MNATKEEMSAENKLWRDVYEFRKEFYQGENDDAYWRKLVDSADALCKKHTETPLVCGLVKSCVDDIEARFKAKKNKESLNGTKR